MGRPREFDESDVLRRATTLFGQRGFDAVSVDAVLSALGLNRASFYKLYGSKHGLAQTALAQVCERARDGDIDQDSKDLVVVSLLELAPVNDVMAQLTSSAVDLCFDTNPTLIGQHMLARANRTTA
ncbi:TetR family transcriptional regulator [Curtobacterium sp. PhB130]|uniref:TetR/AcrR family transcriptional regulator n=1 Tax=Curtobacterium sp. PhB130 TaxID=2485178 RepID=UPI000F4B04FD|nr:helix-turn-helix domain-containing protein [Curtobacterium sp. PhB130]ROS71865.1 TetR family transcriptional regulator [Curtobacterium sp. PhB130]